MRPPGIKVRRAASGDELTLRDLRLQALAESPRAFGSTLERERARTPTEWATWLTPSAIFFLEDGSGAKGLAAGVPDATDSGLVWLMAMWLHPDLRGSGAAGLLVDAVMGWATDVRAERVRLDVVRGNEAAIRLYERYGFRPTGRTAIRARDGAVEIQMERAVRSST